MKSLEILEIDLITPSLKTSCTTTPRRQNQKQLKNANDSFCQKEPFRITSELVSDFTYHFKRNLKILFNKITK